MPFFRSKVTFELRLFLVLAGLLVATAGTRAAEEIRPIPQNPEQQLRRYRDMLAWNRRTLAGAYDKVGRKNSRWDKAAGEALEAAARVFSFDLEPPITWRDVFVAAERAIHAGCDDPLILYFYARSSLAGSAVAREDLDRQLAAATVGLQRSQYPPFRRAVALYRLGFSKAMQTDALPETRKEATRMLDAALALLPGSAAEDERNRDIENLWLQLLRAYVQGFRRLTGDFQAAFARIDAVLPKDPVLKAIRLQAEANFLIEHAWEARGSGSAETVTREGQRKFEERLKKAHDLLESAWTLKPGDSETATRMMTVEMGLGGDRRALETWFERAMLANGNCRSACEVMMEFIDPKWYGTTEEMVAFGRACRDTQNWRAGITLLLADAHYRAVLLEAEPKRAVYFGSADVWKDIKEVFEEYLAHMPNDAGTRSLYAGYCSLCRRYTDANAQFQQLGENLMGGSKFSLSFLKSARDTAARMARSAGTSAPAASATPGFSAKSLKNFVPMAIDWNDPSGERGTLRFIENCCPTQAGFDVLWDYRSVYLLKAPNRATRVYHEETYRETPRSTPPGAAPGLRPIPASARIQTHQPNA